MDPISQGGFTLDKLSRPKKLKLVTLPSKEEKKPPPIPGYMKPLHKGNCHCHNGVQERRRLRNVSSSCSDSNQESSSTSSADPTPLDSDYNSANESEAIKLHHTLSAKKRSF